MKKANKNIITTTGLEITTAFIKNSQRRDVKNKIWVEFPFQLDCGNRDRKCSYMVIQHCEQKIWDEFGIHKM